MKTKKTQIISQTKTFLVFIFISQQVVNMHLFNQNIFIHVLEIYGLNLEIVFYILCPFLFGINLKDLENHISIVKVSVRCHIFSVVYFFIFIMVFLTYKYFLFIGCQIYQYFHLKFSAICSAVTLFFSSSFLWSIFRNVTFHSIWN